MTVTRKQFIGFVAAGVAGTAAWSPRRLLAEAAPTSYSPQMFTPCTGGTFRVTSVADAPRIDPLDLTLQSVATVGTEKETIQFSLEFVGPVGDPLPSRVYLFTHSAVGTIPMFVGPARRDGEGRTLYRADFNILQNARSTVIVPARSKR